MQIEIVAVALADITLSNWPGRDHFVRRRVTLSYIGSKTDYRNLSKYFWNGFFSYVIDFSDFQIYNLKISVTRCSAISKSS